MPKVNTSSGLVGGEEGEPEDRSSSPFCHPGVKVTKCVKDNVYGMRILPAFDRVTFDDQTQADTPEFKMSVFPYRKGETVDPTTDALPFSSWYFLLQGYEFIGHGERSWLSPLSGYRRAERGIDPLYDVWLTAKNHANPDFKQLTIKPEKVEGSKVYSAELAGPRVMGFLNVAMEINGVWENRLLVVRQITIDKLKETLNFPRPANVSTIVTPAASDFLYGDPTDPMTGLWATVQRGIFNPITPHMKVHLFSFSTKPNSLAGAQVFPIDPSTEWGASMLMGRYNIADTAKVTKLTPAEETLEFLVSDGFLPYDLIKEACEANWTVPPQPTNRRYYPGQPPPEEEDPNTLAGRAAPKAPGALARPAGTPLSRPASLGGAAPAAGAEARPASLGQPAKPAATPAGTAAPAGAPARPAAGGGPARPAAAPGGAPRPPAGAPARPAAPGAGRAPTPPAGAARPAATPPRTVAPTPAPQQPAEPAQPPVENTDGVLDGPVPLTAEEETYYTQLEAIFAKDAGSMDQQSMADFVMLSDRITALAAAQPQQ